MKRFTRGFAVNSPNRGTTTRAKHREVPTLCMANQNNYLEMIENSSNIGKNGKNEANLFIFLVDVVFSSSDWPMTESDYERSYLLTNQSA